MWTAIVVCIGLIYYGFAADFMVIIANSLFVPMRKGGPHNDNPLDTYMCVFCHLR